ncbi:hypothetical protein RUM44_006956 [Polyplax serrata]|uniref:Uncharacterized protein n=1 Tax=Polyplax serrata TaxID=468196 RepID=A0ABR1AZE3_POLSC
MSGTSGVPQGYKGRLRTGYHGSAPPVPVIHSKGETGLGERRRNPGDGKGGGARSNADQLWIVPSQDTTRDHGVVRHERREDPLSDLLENN